MSEQGILRLYNLALGVCGSQGLVAEVNEKSREAEVCRLHYEPTRDMVFAAGYWPSLTSEGQLTQYAEKESGADWKSSDPAPGWKYAYNLPPNIVRPRFLSSGAHFAMSRLNGIQTLVTNSSPAVLTFTRMEEDPGQWDPPLYNLMIAALAMEIGRALAISVPAYRRVEMNLQLKQQQAYTIAGNMENNLAEEQVPDWITARDGGYTPMTYAGRFHYPSEVLPYGLH